MLYTTIGSLFLILFGAEIAYHLVWLGPDDGWVEAEPLLGHPVAYNLTGHIIPMVSKFIKHAHYKKVKKSDLNFSPHQTEMNEYNDIVLPAKHDLEPEESNSEGITKKRALIFMAFINVGTYEFWVHVFIFDWDFLTCSLPTISCGYRAGRPDGTQNWYDAVRPALKHI